jgi:putative ABC transport system ATP-binding protein
MTELAIEVKDLEFAWPSMAAFLRVPTLSLQQGQTLFVGGRSGSGKTTLLSLLTGVHSVQKGLCKVLGYNLTEMSASQRDLFRGRNLGLVFQQFNLIPYLTVQENIELPTQIFASRAQHAIDLHGSVTAQVHSLCDSLHLSRQLMARPAHQLSVGEQQRVASARALMGGAYRLGQISPKTTAEVLLQELGPDSLLWGSDWPCTNYEKFADFEQLIEDCYEWIGQTNTHTILDQNPTKLYWNELEIDTDQKASD